MTDLTLLLFGSCISFVFLSGCYIFFRENSTHDEPEIGTAEPIALKLTIPLPEAK